MNNKKSFILGCCLGIALMLTACCEEELNAQSIFTDSVETVQNDFDRWLLKNYVEPYNIEFKYRFEYKETDPQYNLSPADLHKAIALAKLTKHLWIDAYEELMGRDFVCSYVPKILYLVGSPAYNVGGGLVLGTAEGGMKIVLYNVNSLDIHQPDIAFLNEWFFNTMHHEFAHILHQTKAYPPDFNEISKADYQSSSWVNLSNQDALALGFVNNYASSETREDFVQTIAFYITKSDDEWQRRYAGNAKIEQKLSMVKDYLEGSWGINLEQLHQIVQRRQQEVAEGKLDLQSLN